MRWVRCGAVRCGAVRCGAVRWDGMEWVREGCAHVRACVRAGARAHVRACVQRRRGARRTSLFCALVATCPRSEPHCGSVRHMVPVNSPEIILAAYLSLSSSEPWASTCFGFGLGLG